uniref:hypothetical protein n=1 Tax=Saccharothrix mutabilis TaxID=33921 RepID=UPI0031DC59E7
MSRSPRWLTGLFVTASSPGSSLIGATPASTAPDPCLDNGVVGYVTTRIPVL